MAVTKKSGRAVVDLVPWDHESKEHIQRLIEQRIACKWDAEYVEGPWVEEQRAGDKCIYWLVLNDQDSDKASKLRQHVEYFEPMQCTPLMDSCERLRNKSITPSGRTFVPIGHIALDVRSPYTEKYQLNHPLDGSAVWVKSLWISNPLQAGGLGRAALDTLEAMATASPLNATTLLLDTMQKDDQRRLRPKIKVGTQEWYDRRGYRLIHTEPDVYKITPEEFAEHGSGEFVIRTVFMRKDL